MLAAAVVAFALAPTSASATTPKRDVQCAGANIKMNGSTFQNTAQLQWETSSTNPLAFNAATQTNKLACQGKEEKNTKGETTKTAGKPEIVYEQTQATKGSGACLRAFGASGHASETNIFTTCGTDEAPNATQKKEIEEHREGGPNGESLETIPVAQGAEAIIVHLPEGCKAKSEVEEKSVKRLLGRLVLDQKSVEEVYAGKIKNWKELVASVSAGKDELECSGTEAEDRIRPVVREDSSGTTHIFKAFLQQVNTSEKLLMEKFEEVVGGKNTGCGGPLAEQEEFWSEVAEGCQNQRWPKEAEVLRPTESGNPGVIDEVSATPSSIGYADIAVAREYEYFSKKGFSRENPLTKKVETGSGGENKRGSATKRGEQNTRFWAELQNGNNPTKPDEEFTDPSSTFDVEKLGASNCKGTHYVEGGGKEFPPASTLVSWSEAKAALVEEHYTICGLTYDLAFKQYEKFLKPLGIEETEGEARATTAENYLLYEVNGGAGGKALKGHDYEALPSTVLKEAEKGVKEIEW
jgi:ABC-type phosphate transport system substrate-binding protein